MRGIGWSVGLVMMATPLGAVPLEFNFNAGPLLFIENDIFAPQVLSGFTLGEDLLVDVRLDSGAAPLTLGTEVVYTDPTGVISITGAMSGLMLTLTPGVSLAFENFNAFDLTSAVVSGSKPAKDLILIDGADYRTASDWLTNPNDLTQSVMDLNALFGPGGTALPNLSGSTTAVIGYFDTLFGELDGTLIPEEDFLVFDALEFGPVAPVPTPPALPLLASAICLAALGRRLRAKPA